jgi:hypothetical protein
MEGAQRSGLPAIPASVSILSSRKLFGLCPRSRLIKADNHANTSFDEEK